MTKPQKIFPSSIRTGIGIKMMRQTQAVTRIEMFLVAVRRFYNKVCFHFFAQVIWGSDFGATKVSKETTHEGHHDLVLQSCTTIREIRVISDNR